jgi:predicted phage tail component-like protein
MANLWIEIDGVRSDTIHGLMIQSLPPITRPPMRTETQEIDGRDGAIIRPLGYSNYDKSLKIGLKGNFDINQVISYFAFENANIVFSNEDDKYYTGSCFAQIDFEKLIRFREATVTINVKPYKFAVNEHSISNSVTSSKTLILGNEQHDEYGLCFKTNGNTTALPIINVAGFSTGDEVTVTIQKVEYDDFSGWNWYSCGGITFNPNDDVVYQINFQNMTIKRKLYNDPTDFRAFAPGTFFNGYDSFGIATYSPDNTYCRVLLTSSENRTFSATMTKWSRWL